MTYSEFFELFAGYGLDVVFLTLLNAAVCVLLKRTLLKNKPRAVLLVAYFAGTAMYIIYQSAHTLNAAYIIENLVSATEHGLSIGTLTVLVCAAFDKFLGGGSSVSVQDAIGSMLEGFVADGNTEACAEKICSQANAEDNLSEDSVFQIIKEYANQSVTEAELSLLARLIFEALPRLGVKINQTSESSDTI